MVHNKIVQAWYVFLDSSNDIHVDIKNKVITTPAFMCETGLHEVHDGIGKMINAVVEMVA